MCQLVIEEAEDILLAGFLAPHGIQRLSGHDFCRAQLVFVEIVFVHFLCRESGVAVALPTAA